VVGHTGSSNYSLHIDIAFMFLLQKYSLATVIEDLLIVKSSNYSIIKSTY
jgi:hypothetical protein